MSTGTSGAAGAADPTTVEAAAHDLCRRARAGEVRAVARIMRDLDDRTARGFAALAELYGQTGKGFVIGITGPPGSGKSTLVDGLIAQWRAAGRKVGVVAVDPSSPISGGAVLGDRVRMMRHALDPDVYIRSLATRGNLGGLSRSTSDVVAVMDALGYDPILVETVGVGQDEVEVARTADVTCVVTVPGLGDSLQAMKAGLMEVADLYIVNKADRDGAERVVTDLESMLAVRRDTGHKGPVPRILKTVAKDQGGLKELVEAVDALRPQSSPALQARLAERRHARAREELLRLLGDMLREAAESRLGASGELARVIDDLAERRLDPYTAARRAQQAASAS
jgi:LAO/AO transport system kinase